MAGRFTGVLSVGLAASLSAGCLVPAARVEEANQAMERERQARLTTEQQLDALSQRLASVANEQKQREAELERCSQRLAQADYDQAVVVKERDDAKQLVAQLRDELGRIGAHIREYAERNRELKGEVERMQVEAERLEQQEADADARAQLLRDLAFELEDDAKQGSVTLAMSGGVPVVRLDPNRVLDRRRKKLTPSGARIVRGVAKLLGPLQARRVELYWRSPEQVNAERQGELGPIVDGLSRAGLEPQRISIASQSALPEPGSGPQEWIELVIRRKS